MRIPTAFTLCSLVVLVSCVATSAGTGSTSSSPSMQSKPVCAGPFTCDGGTSICRQSGRGFSGSLTIDDDARFSVRSDGRGPYVAGRDDVGNFSGSAVVLFWRTAPKDTAGARFFSIDLSRPVPGDVGRPLGTIRDSYAELAAQWFTEPAFDSTGTAFRLQHTVMEIPIGITVLARQVNIGVHVNGRYHILQMGPQPTSHCFREGTAIYGDGTTQARITRVADSTFVVEAPPGSIGRLFDTYHTSKYAENRGLYHVAFRYTIRQ